MQPILALLGLASLTPGQTPCQAPFPMTVTADHRADGGGLELELNLEDSQALAASDRVRFEGVTLPDGASVDLELRRVTLDDSELVVLVDGIPGRQDDGGSILWSGKVVGDAESDVYLAFSPFGSRGWIRRSGETFHLLAGPGVRGGWSRSTSRLVSEASLLDHGAKPPRCASEEIAVPGRRSSSPSSLGGGNSPLTMTTLTCRMALETDYQLFADFNDLTAEQTYITQLFAAANARYVEQVNTVLQRVYIAYYTNPNDPWTTADIGGTSYDMLLEFQAAWANNLPNGANLGHFLSGANLGGGIAWLDVLCNSTYGFAVSGNITIVSGLTPFPVVQGPSNWDFMVLTHETGHNFGTPHTHDFCPPIDQCAPPGYFGGCQTQQVCINNGTLMSYCHLCPGGLSNIYPYFAQPCVDIMRQRAEASCIGPWCTGPSNYCPATLNSTGMPGAITGTGSASISLNTFTLVADQLPHNKTVLFFYGDEQVQVAQGQGFRCVGGHVYRLLPAVNSGPNGTVSRLLDFTHPPASGGPSRIEPGSSWNFQAYYRDPSMGNGNYNMTDAMWVPFCP